MLPAAAMALAVVALAGCSTSSDNAADSGPQNTVQTDADASGDPDAAGTDGDAPGIAVPGEEEGEEGEEERVATPNPEFAEGSAITSVQYKGYQASIDVLSLPRTPAVKKPWEEAPRPHPVKGGEEAVTAPGQTAAPTAKAPKIDVNVQGLDYDTWGAGHPPDTSGAVGPNQFVQTVNTSIGIYSKAGKQLNAFTFNTFFSQFHSGTPCDNQNGGDPQVIFDQPSNRWIVGDLSYPGPYYFCMAVSDGPDITGKKWTLYPFKASETALNDYPKIASGPNGLFMTANMFENFQTFNGAQVWAFERKSLGTKKLNSQTVKTSSQYGSLLPANSYAAKESKGPDYLVSLESSTSIGLWEYEVNWAKPSKSRFTQTPNLIKVDSYQTAGSVPEKSGNNLDTLSDRPMYQLQLNKGTLWFNHSVATDGRVGVRWYQIGNIADKSPKVLQQSTFAPNDKLYRWMGSLAVDKDGNMGVGFNTSSASDYPSINYATRKSDDPKNKLTAEGNIVKGKGSQTGLSRWGDYSQMSIDPEDGCTFWYTGEYYLQTGGDWQTRIASFKFPSCS